MILELQKLINQLQEFKEEVVSIKQTAINKDAEVERLKELIVFHKEKRVSQKVEIQKLNDQIYRLDKEKVILTNKLESAEYILARTQENLKDVEEENKKLDDASDYWKEEAERKQVEIERLQRWIDDNKSFK